MDRVLVSWSIPNMITVWLMLLVGLFVLAALSQVVMKATGNSGAANNAGGY